MENLFSLFCLTWWTVLEMWTRLFWKGQVKASKKCLAIQAIDISKKDKTKAKSSFVDVENA